MAPQAKALAHGTVATFLFLWFGDSTADRERMRFQNLAHQLLLQNSQDSQCQQACVQDGRLADLASDDTRRARLEAIAASVEVERGRECTFKPVLSCGTARRLADQENTDPADEVGLLLGAWHKLRHWQRSCLSHSRQIGWDAAMV